MKFLIRFAQVHESFRRAEIEAIGTVEGLGLSVLEYDLLVSTQPQTNLTSRHSLT